MRAKVVFITGCSTGIGWALAMEFVSRGFKVLGTVRKPKDAERLQAQGVFPLIMDVTNKEQIEAGIATGKAKFGTIDILINNAGYGLIAPIIEVPADELLKQFETNVFAPLRLVKFIAEDMKKNKRGMIVNIGSVSGIVTTPFSGAYCASKAALHAISDALRMELAPFGINVVTVQPGAVQSAFGSKAHNLVTKILKPNSWYTSIESFILDRANASQKGAMPAAQFARKLVPLLLKKNPPAIIRIAPKSRLLPFLKAWIPTYQLDRIFAKKFGLDQLKP